MRTGLSGTGTLAAAGAVLGLVLGAAGGVLAAGLARPEPTAAGTAVPVAAVSPSYPVDPEPEVVPDPDTPALAPGVPTRPAEIEVHPYRLRLPVPVGWLRSDSSLGEWKWLPPDQPGDNSFFLRVRLIGGVQTRAAVLQQRLDALGGASEVEDLVVESRDEKGFTATYVLSGYRRVAMERFLSVDGSTAYAAIALIGRERDRRGMADLVERIVRGATTS
ncbi:hypothetical protein [Nocardioides sp. SYSU DS0663]|uniref:hypothetical protein n=1 Tax=Nocardioides sp. SYSU DS0663 TaxID=3416445 RepID=UPI003F4B8DEE